MRLSEVLHKEHQRTLIVLDELDGWRGKSCPKLDDITKLLEDLIDVTENDVTNHYAFEEEHLFPILRQNGADFMVNMLTSEHRMIRPIAQKLNALSQSALANGFNKESWDAFMELSFEFIGHETFHIQKEEMGLINALNSIFTKEMEAPLLEIYSNGKAA